MSDSREVRSSVDSKSNLRKSMQSNINSRAKLSIAEFSQEEDASPLLRISKDNAQSHHATNFF